MNFAIMRAAGFGKEVNRVQMGLCPFCAKEILDEDFKDELSRKEYAISGLCQACQDNFYK